ncbi:MAG: SDR family oxidoreductase [Armatimonadetes bacterium]|nr:SDR family oxidoreductase [Armatimonadota bacterium]
MRVLVTGGAGFIGSHLATELAQRGFTVRVLDNYATGKPENLAHIRDRVEVIEGSVTDACVAARAARGCEAVLHQAAIPSVARSVQDPIGTNQANVTGTITMLTVARDAGVRRFVYAGSSSAYGDNPALPKREEMTPLPRSPYAVAKLAGEHYCRVFGHLFGMETVCLRYFNVFGPRQDPASRYAAVVPAFIQAMLAGKPLRVDGDGTQSRDFTYVENVVQANLRALEAPGVSGEVFNIACGQRYDLNFLVRELAAIIGTEPRVERAPARPGDVPHSLADISKAQRLLGFEPAVDFREGLRRTVAWLRGEERSLAA